MLLVATAGVLTYKKNDCYSDCYTIVAGYWLSFFLEELHYHQPQQKEKKVV